MEVVYFTIINSTLLTNMYMEWVEAKG